MAVVVGVADVPPRCASGPSAAAPPSNSVKFGHPPAASAPLGHSTSPPLKRRARLSATDHPRLGTTPPLEATTEPRVATCAFSRRGRCAHRREGVGIGSVDVSSRSDRGRPPRHGATSTRASARRDVRVGGVRLPRARTVPRSARTTRGDLHRRADAGVASASRSARSPRGSPSSSRVFTRRASTNDLRARGGFGIKTLAGVTHEKLHAATCCAPAGQLPSRFALSLRLSFPARRPLRRARRGATPCRPSRDGGSRGSPLRSRGRGIDGAARRASTLDRRSDGQTDARHVGDSSAATGLNGRMALRGRGGRARPAAGRGVDGVDDRSGNRREVREYPFGRVSRTSNPVVPSETAPSVISHAERADRGDGSWTQQNASRARWEQTGRVSGPRPPTRGRTGDRRTRMTSRRLPRASRRAQGGGSRVARTARSPSVAPRRIDEGPGETGVVESRARRRRDGAPTRSSPARSPAYSRRCYRPSRRGRAARARAPRAREPSRRSPPRRGPQAGDPARSCAAEPRNVARVFASGDVLDLLADARPERVMGHFRAREAPRRALRRVESHGDVLLRAPAARASPPCERTRHATASA